ncbi:hypothetical protein PCE1_000360 [Barthelona sp. PCE]
MSKLFRKEISHDVDSIDFSYMTESEIERISTVQISNPTIFNSLQQPNKNSLYDLRMGAFDVNQVCETCQQGYFECEGHCGHVDFSNTPLYNPFLLSTLVRCMKGMCLNCFHFRASPIAIRHIVVKMKLIHAGLVDELAILDTLPTAGVAKSKDESEDVMFNNDYINEILNELEERAHEKFETPGFNPKDISNYHLVQEQREILSAFWSITDTKTCASCGCSAHKITAEQRCKLRLKYNVDDLKRMRSKNISPDPAYGTVTVVGGANKGKILTPPLVKERFERLLSNEADIFSMFFSSFDENLNRFKRVTSSTFFVHKLLVPPNRFRPPSFFDGQSFEHAQNQQLLTILGINYNLNETIRKLHKLEGSLLDETNPDASINIDENEDYRNLYLDFNEKYSELQLAMNSWFDSANNHSKDAPNGIRQILEKKEGLFRMNMMGKRVNFSARSVISPDPYIAVNEIGLPLYFAKKLSFPEPVNPHNKEQLKQMVINGPETYPGANYVEDQNGRLYNLGTCSEDRRLQLAKSLTTRTDTLHDSELPNSVPKRVYRHLCDGDPLLVNRQPTLHKASMLAAKGRVIHKGKTIRMHYANCKSFNADFDGDEINLHYLQDQLSRTEGLHLANANLQYISQTDSSPLRGLVLDHIVAGMLLTKLDTFFDAEHFKTLVVEACMSYDSNFSRFARISLPKPAIMFPERRWTGKQVISAILLHISKQHGKKLNNISKCKIPVGVWGVGYEHESHVIIRDSQLLTGIAGKSQIGASNYGMVHAVHQYYDSNSAGALLSSLGRVLTKYLQMKGFTVGIGDLIVTKQSNKNRHNIAGATDVSGEEVAREFLTNELGVSEMAGRSEIDAALMHVFSDQSIHKKLDSAYQAKNGQLTTDVIEDMFSTGQIFPFPQNNFAAMVVSGAKGSKVNFSQIMCLLGQQALEGRRVPVMLSGKTLPCFQPMETDSRAGGFIFNRFLTGLKPYDYYFHCMAGREGLVDTAVKTAVSGYLQRCLIKAMEGISVSYDGSVRDFNNNIVQFLYGEDGLDTTRISYLKQFDFFKNNLDLNVSKSEMKSYKSIEKKQRKIYLRNIKGKVQKKTPLLNRQNPYKKIGVCSENYFKDVEDFTNSVKFSNEEEEAHFKYSLMKNYQECLVDPGEVVGIVAGQSIGEPSTQMTLNTFHLAGHGAVNVTLGIPRLREIVMTAAKVIKTPNMSIHIKSGEMEDAERVAKILRPTMLTTLWKNLTVVQTVEGSANGSVRVYTIQVHFADLPEDNKDAMQSALVQYQRKVCHQIDVILRRMNISFTSEAIATTESQRRRVLDEEMESDDEDMGEEAGSLQKSRNRDYEETEDDVVTEKDVDDEIINEEEEKEEEKPKKKPKKKKNTHATDYLSDAGWEGNTFAFRIALPLHVPRLLAVALCEEAAMSIAVSQVPGITNSYIFNKPEGLFVQTEGINLEAAFQIGINTGLFELSDVDSNDVDYIRRVFGIEACRNAIIKEVSSIFSAYGITVDYRHLSLLADYITVGGDYRAFNRIGIGNTQSPMTKATFETSVKFISECALRHDRDSLFSPSGSISVGMPIKTGTGAFEILQPLE